MSDKHYVLNVPAVSCNHCKMAVEGAVGRLKGVSSVNVEVPAQSVDVEFDPSAVSLDELKDVLKREGYPVAGAHEFGA
jgi:copper chaperone